MNIEDMCNSKSVAQSFAQCVKVSSFRRKKRNSKKHPFANTGGKRKKQLFKFNPLICESPLFAQEETGNSFL